MSPPRTLPVMKKSPKKLEFDPSSAVQIEGAILRLQSFREHSDQELLRKCQSRGFGSDAVRQTLQSMAERGLQSNQRYMDALIYARRRKGFGPARIRAELRDKGISGELVQRGIVDCEESWPELLANLMEKKFQGKMATDPKEKAKQFRFLQYRGFTPEQIRRWMLSKGA